MRLTDDLWIDIENELFQQLKEIYFNPIFELLKMPLYNSSNTVIDALTKGEIVLKNGEISGAFNISISKELSKFSEFDKRSKIFKIKDKTLIPNDILLTSIVANEKSRKLHDEINRRLQSMGTAARERFKTLKFSIDKSAYQIESVLNQEYKKLGIIPTMSPTLKEKLINQYNENLNLSIVDENNPGQDWNSTQIERLRNMITKSATEGYNKKNLIDMIQNEFETTRSKAKFLARQETTLFLSDYREERFKSSGIKYYIWSTSNDRLVVGNPNGEYPIGSKGHMNHYVLQGKICSYYDATIYADSLEDAKNGKWKSRASIGAECQHPGRAYLCRCASIPIIE
jgi:hypothetical protein